MASTTHLTVSKPHCTASSSNSAIANPTPYLSHYLRIPPEPPMTQFAAEHRRNAKRLLDYQANGRKGSKRLGRAVLDEFDHAAAIDLLANNPESRIAFAGIMVQHLQALADAEEDTPFHWITLIPKQFSIDEGGRF